MSVPVSVPANQPSSAREQLECLLTEVNGLTLRVKRTASLHSGGELPQAARAVLQLLQRQGHASVPMLARARGTSRQNIQGIVNRLKKAGLVGMAENPAHKRSELVFITQSGSAVLEQGDQRGAEVFDLLLASIPADELALASGVIRRLSQALEQGPLARRGGKLRALGDSRPETPAAESQSLETDLPVSLL